MASGNQRKLAMIGVDAAELSYVRENLSHLPNFRRALENRAVTDLTSQAALIPGSVWPSFFTESGPGEHGFYLILAWDPDAMRLKRVTGQRLPMDPFWRKLARAGVDVIAIDVPMSDAPADGPGIEIAGWGTHDGLTRFSARPRTLEREILRRFGAHPIGLEIPVAKSAAQRERIKRQLVEGARRKGELTQWLAATQRWDLLLVVFSELHRGGHVLWPSNESVRPEWLLEVYCAVDRALGEIVSSLSADNTTVWLFALHGMGPNNSQEHFTQEIVARINARFGASEGARSITVAPRGPSPINALRKRMPPRAQTAIARAVPQWARDLVVDRSYTAGFDWRRTPAIALRSDRNGYIRLNIKGRERDGMLEAGSVALRSYVADLREGFASFSTEHGTPLVTDIRMAAEAAPGRRTNLLPDMIVAWNESRTARRIDSPILGEIVAHEDTGRTGHHRTRGFLAAMSSGNRDVARGAPQMSIENLADAVRQMLAGNRSAQV
ncbi:MAG TPA: alkaline phosphatase family protein [Candidatus Acidoferrales bacterium]|nr:alkaline phosphatase family protein [Candidatus Acidoferrales bacterium]